jgi:phage tail sheath protein FI
MLVDNSSLDLTGSFSSPIYESLTGGADGAGESSIAFGKIALGYDLYKDAIEVDISGIICGKSSNANLANYLTQNIAEVRKDCVVYASPTYADVVAPANPATKTNNAVAFRNNCTSSSYLVIDSGYKYRYDKYNDVYHWVPLNGDIAGLSARIEPWESPAGYKRGVIKNVVKLAFNPNKAQRDQLYGSDVNPVISQVGQGVLLFGDKTALGTSTGSAFTRINVRRLFIAVEKAIATVAASFLFDFNDEFTQTQFKNLVEPFLRDIQGRRGIIDFRVISDGTVNTPDIIDRNIFRGNIFIKPARSINVIELTFVATRTGVEFDEIVGQPL